jgi:hypothetical protein
VLEQQYVYRRPRYLKNGVPPPSSRYSRKVLEPYVKIIVASAW